MRIMKDFRTQFDAELTEWFSAKRRQYLASYAADPLFFALFDAVEELSLSGGKRVRPYMASLMFEAVHGDAVPDLYPLMALELFHVFGLVHDDIIDGGDSRRGVRTVHRRMIDDQYDGNVHIGQSQAMLMGDLVFSWCHELFDESDYLADIRTEVKGLFAKMSEAVMIGQMIDVDLTMQDGATMERITEKMRLKTASYTFVYPLQIGIALGGGNPALAHFAEEFGTAIGLAFQIQDDLLDLLGDEEVTGKTPLRDIVEGQHTLVTQHVFDTASIEDIELLETYFRKEVPAEAVTPLRDMFERTGAFAFARTEADKYFATAAELLANANMDETTRTALSTFLTYIQSRNV